MAARPKVQHWVPKFYLRQFAIPETRQTDRPKVWIFSKHQGEPKLTSVRNVAARSHLYTPIGATGGRDWKMEEMLGDIESLLARLWPELTDGFADLHGQESIRKIVALFVSTLHLRHPDSIRVVVEMHENLVSLFEGCPKDAAGNPLISEVDYRGDVRPFDNSGYQAYKSAGPDEIRQMFVDGIRAHATWFAEALMEKRWSVVFSESPVFVTTDTPVAIVNRFRERFGITTPGTVVSIPLSPTRVLLMDDRNDQPQGRYYPLAAHGPAPFNLSAWHGCERFMISSRDPDEVCAEILAWTDANPPSGRPPPSH